MFRAMLLVAAFALVSPQHVEAPSLGSPEGACCKVCRKGKACGDSCIARDRVCRQPPGCACDG